MRSGLIAGFSAAAAALALVACGGEQPDGTVVFKHEFGEKWPFTVDEVELLCVPPADALAKTPDGKVYALSGSARSKAKESGWLDGYEITKPNPEIQQIKMDYSELVKIAQAPCIAENTTRK